MSDTRVNLATSLHSTTVNLSEVAAALPALGTDEDIERLAKILEHIAEEASDGATILRVLITRHERERVAGLRASAPRVAASDHQAPEDAVESAP